MNSDNSSKQTRNEKREIRRRRTMRVHGSGMKILAHKLTERKSKAS